MELNYLLTILKFTLTIKDNSDTLFLQKNLDMVNEWSHKWLLKFNVDKCKLLQLGNSSPANYYLSSPDGFFRSLICKVTEEEDLGVWCTSDMKPSLQVQKAVTKAMQTLSMLKRSFKFLSSGRRTPGFLELLLSANIGMLACVCPPPRLLITSDVMWCDIDPILLVK